MEKIPKNPKKSTKFPTNPTKLGKIQKNHKSRTPFKGIIFPSVCTMKMGNRNPTGALKIDDRLIIYSREWTYDDEMSCKQC
jgi:hypothetical protein